MTDFDWEPLLRQWSIEVIAMEDFLVSEFGFESLPSDIVSAQWLGFPGATPEEVAEAEKRLGVALPPSYRSFLRVTNGWRHPSLLVERLWSTNDIEWFKVRHQEWLDIWLNPCPPFPITHAPDEKYFVYGKEQNCLDIRAAYLQTALDISERFDGAIFLLNPQVVTLEGEWEAWFFATWLMGAFRYPSFWDMMVSEHENFLNMRRSST